MRETVRRTVLRTAARGLRKGLALPDPLLRRIVGGPIRVDGDELSPTAQLLIKVERLFQRDEPPLESDLPRARREFDLVSSTMLAGSGPGIQVRDTMVGGAKGLLRARIYLPPGATRATPTMVYFHGGGFVLGSIDSHDGVCRFLSRHSGVRIISVEYRLAPENPYANHLRRDGVPVTRLHYGGLVHGFATFLASDAHSRRAAHGIAGALRRIAKPAEPGSEADLGT